MYFLRRYGFRENYHLSKELFQQGNVIPIPSKPREKIQGLPRYRFFPADTYGFFLRFPVLHFLAVPISAVPGTAKYCFRV